MEATRSVPYCELDFHTSTSLFSAYSLDGSPDPSSDVIRVNTSKNLSSTAGDFTIELVYNELWYKSMDSMDIVVIKMGRLGKGLDSIMVGLVDQVRKSVTISGDGKPTRCIRVIGRDFGKVFLKCLIEFFPEIGDMPTQQAMLQFFVPNNLTHGKPSSLVYQVLTQILPKFMNFSMKYWDKNSGKMTDNMTVLDVIRFRLGSGDVILPIVDTLDSLQGSIWNFMTYGLNAPFTELFLDTRSSYEDMIRNQDVQHSSYGVRVKDPVTGVERMTYEGYKFGEDDAKVILFMRPTPFNKDDWNNLCTRHVYSHEVMSEDLGRSDHQHYNLFFAVPKLYTPYASTSDTDIRMVVKPPHSKQNMLRYGINVLKVECPGLTYAPDDNFFKATAQLSQQLQDWYGNNHKFEEGSKTLHGRGDIKIGEKIQCVDDGMEYYVEGVTQDWVNVGNTPYWSTGLTLTRGQTYQTTPVVSLSSSTLSMGSGVQSPLPSVPTAPQVQIKYHNVIKGDTLWGISVKYYGNGNKWRKIYDANKDIVKLSADGATAYIYVGQRLHIPS